MPGALRSRLRRLWAALLVAAVLPAAAQDYPSRPVRIIVPFAPGGSADVFGRFIAQKLQEALGQPFVVEDRPGGGSVIGTDAVAKSAPDGYTLLLMSNTHTVNESLIPSKPFVLTRDFVAIAPINYSDLVLVTKADLPQKTLRDLIAAAKAKPGGMSYASSGPGTPYHMAGELFKAMAGISMVHIPYKGSAGARSDVLGGQLEMMFDAIPTMSEHIKARQGARHRHHRQAALGGAARRADHGRGRRARLRGHHLARPDGAQGHTAGHRQQAACRAEPHHVERRGAPRLDGAGHDGDDDERR